MKCSGKNLVGRLVGGVLLAGAVAAVFFYEGKPAEEPVDTTVRPIKSMVVGSGFRYPKLYFPGIVQADAEVALSFEVGGRLIELQVRPGMVVEQGAVLARLDPRNFENQVKTAEAELERARSSLERIEKALASQAVSQEEYSRAKAARDMAAANLAIHRKALDDTRLEARFAGVIADTFVDNFDNVTPGQPILRLQDVSTMAVVIAVPEPYMLRGGARQQEETSFRVRFDSIPDQSFPLILKQYATTADPVTRTYRVTFSLAKLPEVRLLPDVVGTVEIERKPMADDGAEVSVPSDAVGFASDGQPFVWVLEPAGNGVHTARRQTVELGRRSGGDIEVTAGLAKGSRIALAGVAVLAEGRAVRPLEDGPLATEAAQ